MTCNARPAIEPCNWSMDCPNERDMTIHGWEPNSRSVLIPIHSSSRTLAAVSAVACLITAETGGDADLCVLSPSGQDLPRKLEPEG